MAASVQSECEIAGDVQSESDLIQQFINITGTDNTVAKNMLEAFNNNLEMAINMFLEGHTPNQEEVREVAVKHGVCTGGSSTSNTSDSSDSNDKRTKHSKRLKNSSKQIGESMSSNQNNGLIFDDDEEEVRAPIPQRQEVLVEDQYHAIPFHPRPRRVPRSVFNACRDFQKESEEHEEHLKSKKSTVPSRKRKRLHDLFQPPVDLIHLGDFQSARDVCNAKKKWLLVNIQNSIEFACQVVNRDVWSNHIVRDIINANFIMWQVSHDSDEGLHYATFYNVKNYPHISVIDPRTGERMVVWENFGMKPSADQFAELATHFLSEHPNLNESFEIKDEAKKSIEKKSVIDLGEEDQLEAAITASLTTVKEVLSENEDDSDTVVVDDDDDEQDRDENLKNPTDIKNKKICIPESPEHTNDSILNNENSKDSDNSSKKCENDNICEDENISNYDENLSSHEGEKATILLRLPDNGRKQILFPLECTLKDLSVELSRLGWPDIRYEIIKAFPRQNISQLDQKLTLKEAGLHKQETLFIQDR